MSVSVRGVAACRRELEEIEKFLNSEKPMRGIVEDIKDGVLEKTAQGHDYRGRNFSPYSAAYKDKRQRAGLSPKPNLEVSGTMLGSIRTAVLTARHGRVFVGSAQAGGIGTDMLAQIHNTGTGKQPRREFMNVTPHAVGVLTKKHYDDPLLEIVRRYR